MSQTLPDAASPDTLRLLAARRSVPAKAMTGPGPSREQADEILRLAARVPDHRMLEPFRFVVLEGAGKARFAGLLRGAPTAPEGKAEKAASLYERAPLVVAVVSSVDPEHETPVWEQELTAGAACQNLLIAAHAQGWGAQWLTGWPAYDRTVAEALRLGPHERVAGFIFVGTPTARPDDRRRPDMDAIVTGFPA